MNDMERKVFIAGLTAAIIAKCGEEGLNVKTEYAKAQATLYADGETGGVIGDMTLQAVGIMRMIPRERNPQPQHTVDYAWEGPVTFYTCPVCNHDVSDKECWFRSGRFKHFECLTQAEKDYKTPRELHNLKREEVKKRAQRELEELDKLEPSKIVAASPCARMTCEREMWDID